MPGRCSREDRASAKAEEGNIRVFAEHIRICSNRAACLMARFSSFRYLGVAVALV